MTAPKTDEAAIRQTIRALVAAGFTLTHVEDGGDEEEPVTTEAEAMDAITAVDYAWLAVTDTNGGFCFVSFVLGNEPFEVIENHSDSLSPVLDPLMARWAA